MDDDPNDLAVLLHGSKVFLELLFAIGITPPFAGLCEGFFLALVPESYTEGAERGQPATPWTCPAPACQPPTKYGS